MSTDIAAPLSKSQKKRMKRNKAKLRKEKAASTEPVLNPLNTHDAMKAELQELGFELSDINQSIEEMWNKDLDYSDIHAVIVYMTAKQGDADDKDMLYDGDDYIKTVQTADTFLSEISDDSSNASKQSCFEEETEIISSDAISSNDLCSSNAPITATKTDSVSLSEVKNTKEAPVAVQKAESKTDIQKENNSDVTETKSATRAKKKTPPTIKTKLDIVANNEDLTDAIAALTEWILKAATPSDIKELCNDSESCPLRNVVRRTIVNSGPRNFSGQLLDLIGSILRITGIASTELSSSAKALMHTLTRAKDLISIDTNMTEDIADFVADIVTLNISRTVTKITASSSGTLKYLSLLGDEIENLMKTNVPRDSGVGGLVASRDHLKVLAEKQQKLLDAKMKVRSVKDNDKSQTSAYILDSKDEMMVKICGCKYEAISSSKAKYDELKKQKLSNPVLNDRERLLSNVDSLTVRKNDVAEKIKELEIEMKRLSVEQEEIMSELDVAQNELVKYDASLTEEAKEVERALMNVEQLIKLNDSVSNVVDSMNNFQSEIHELTSNKVNSLHSDIAKLESDLPPNFDAYLNSMSNYFDSEFKLVSFLRSRVQNLRSGLPRLEMEIEACQSLGMISNVADIKKKMNQLQQNIADDENIISTLEAEAKDMKESLKNIVKEYESTGASMESYETVLKTIQDTIETIL